MDFKGILQEMKHNWMFSAILSIVLGLILLIFPGITIRVVCFLLAGLSLIFGVTRMIRYFKQEAAYPEFFRGDLMVGLFAIAIGLFMLLRADLVVQFIPIIFGIVLMASGIAGIQRAVDAQRSGYDRWGVLLALAILTIALGVLLLINPFGPVKVAVAVIGASLIYEGISDLLSMHLVGKRIEDWKKSMEK